MKRQILWTIILVCLVGIIVFFVIFIRRIHTFESNSYEAIPDDVAMVVDIRNMNVASTLYSGKSNLWNGFSQLPFVERGNDFIAKIDSTIQHNETFNSFSSNQLLFVVKQIGKNKLDFLYIIPLQKNQTEDLVKQLLTETFPLSGETSSITAFAPVYSYNDKDSERGNLSFAIKSNTLMVSESKVMVESALKGIADHKNVCNDSDFMKVKANDSKVPAKLYFHYDRMLSIYQLIGSEENTKHFTNFSKIASWTELDLSVNEQSIRLNGYITTDSASHEAEFMNLFEGQTSARGSICKIMPAATNYFSAIYLSDKNLYRKNYETYLSKNSYFNSYVKTLKTLNSQFSGNEKVDFTDKFYELFDNEMAYVMMPSFSENRYENVFAVIKLRSTRQAETFLQQITNNYAETNQQPTEVINHRTANNESFTIYKLPIARIPQAVWGEMFSRVTAKFVTIVDSYMVFANTLTACKEFVNDVENGKTLMADPDYSRFSDNIKSSYSLYTYASIPESIEIFKDCFNAKTKKIIDQNGDELREKDAFSYQLIADKGVKIYNDIFISLNSKKSDLPNFEWRSGIDTTIAIPPVMFTSHRDESLTLLQDANNQLYLIDNISGRTIWKKPLDGKILGTINFVDALANKKQQYLFNTSNTVYLLDRNGENVGNFPLQLSQPASTGIAVFDYDKNRKYRLLVPLQSQTLEMYAMEGGLQTKIQNWEFKTEGEVLSTPRHFVDAGKDFIVFSDTYHIYIVDRRGEIRVKVDELIEKAPNAHIEFESGAKPTLSRFITTDADGMIREIFLDGKVRTTDMGKRSLKHHFMLADVNNDGNGEYVFVDDNKIDVLTTDGKRLFSYSADSPLSTPFTFKIAGETQIAAFESAKSRVHIVNSEGSLYSGFPLAGTSDFAVETNKSKKGFNLIVGGVEPRLLYNYSVK